ncbi:MAG: phenylalanine--tRNA ligase subunit alpha [Candidatus Cloacimonetes bacterium]|nr:phenylalanine--tRNA ligase subunit alpha [Candidatus Cloacimonadota bacterium]
MNPKLETIWNDLNEESSKIKSTKDALTLKGKFIGKQGIVPGLLKTIKDLPIEEKKTFGKEVNELKVKIQDKLFNLVESFENKGSTSIDLSMPGLQTKTGTLHPITQTIQDLTHIFKKLGFAVETGPEIENDYYNFEALNIPEHHPARDTQDTFFIDEKHVLRTQTSGIQIRTMENQKPPIRIVAPGKVFRVDHDVTHSPVFHQIEGLMVDKDINFRHLKYILRMLIHELFGQERAVRFRPSFFPFTEPSAEMDVSCFKCNGKGCRLCSNTGWIEILGCGMVDPNVLTGVGIDPDVYSGWAFGVGIERIAMLKYAITDIRLFYENDLRFLKQFIKA